MIASAVFLYMKWYGVDASESRKILRQEIITREEKYCRLKDDFLARGNLTEKTIQWLELLDLVTAGNFAWSMTTARYHHNAEGAYPGLRTRHQQMHTVPTSDTLSEPISLSAMKLKKHASISLGADLNGYSGNGSIDHATSTKLSTSKVTNGFQEPLSPPEVPRVPSLYSYEDVSVLLGGLPSQASGLTYVKLILEPEKYITSMPSKGVRNTVIDGLEAWYQVPESSLATIREIVNALHSASLMQVCFPISPVSPY